ncbi:similar to Saccharomyces cerevisiae YNL133C FYV6 Protein of unknown function, required for survival upon exposure to K1 killer toxin [Maudiozyma saulgeensis]|uniref:FAM192A/Fyv6 N-terminal domain-containing protein n=1 Tax=Maudiozyma saulgeensis TaxID=1789683 RepID=A0A1X7QZP6_9SACH|nr:similar to Saccharomyces cerevisiae YNL133C FYV6 Protein of unknown function, required for survival upon exposure to K1 killer toxin [Kazachstania saulgeensis]
MVSETIPTNNSRKKKLTFISEGSANIEVQKNSEERAQEKYETEKLRRTRKSLSDQLRSNAASKQKAFKNEVRKREKFNRLSREELNFFKDIKDKEQKKENELKRYLDQKTESFDKKRRKIEKKVNSNQEGDDSLKSKTTSIQNDMVSNKIIKKKNKKIKLKLNL